MSRSGYSDCLEDRELNLWRGAVASAIRGKCGQSLLIEMAKALDAMPIKRLVSESLVTKEGEVCALGAVAKSRGIKTDDIDPEESDQVAALFGIAPALAKEIVFENDECQTNATPEERWARMRKWVDENLKEKK